jgi:hypothetical protein
MIEYYKGIGILRYKKSQDLAKIVLKENQDMVGVHYVTNYDTLKSIIDKCVF